MTVSGLAAGTYDIYVYTDGDNAGFSRTASYELITSAGLAGRTSATDPANTNFSGTFIQAANSNGNYVVFRGVPVIAAASVTVAAQPQTASDLRAPINGIQIVPSAP